MATVNPTFEDRAVDGNGNTNANNTSASSFSLANNAEHLDRLEASDEITDIASFQDIDLPPPENHNHASDIHYGSSSNNGNHHPNDGSSGGIDNVVGVRRAKRFYYCLPMMQQYKYVIFGCLSVFIVVIVATSFTATSARNAKQQAKMIAQQQQSSLAHNNNAHNPNIHPTIINDAPPSPSTTTTMLDHDEELGDVIESDETDGTQPPRETPFPTTAFHYDQQSVSSNHAPSPSSSSSSSSNNNNKPKWFTTNHEQYKSTLMSHQTYGEEMHSHSIARLFCQDLDMTLCSYDEYCPNGIGRSPYEGVHDGSHLGWDASQAEQWAPYMLLDNSDESSSSSNSSSNSNVDERIDWVQVGTVPEYEDGTLDNGYGRCYSFLQWSNNNNSQGSAMDIEDTIETSHRRWILCCSN